MLLDRIARIFGLRDSPAGAIAKTSFRRDYPDFVPRATSTRAVEQQRLVIAVFYSSSFPSRPMPYKLYMVSSDLVSARELPSEESVAYRIPNYK